MGDQVTENAAEANAQRTHTAHLSCSMHMYSTYKTTTTTKKKRTKKRKKASKDVPMPMIRDGLAWRGGGRDTHTGPSQPLTGVTDARLNSTVKLDGLCRRQRESGRASKIQCRRRMVVGQRCTYRMARICGISHQDNLTPHM